MTLEESTLESPQSSVIQNTSGYESSALVTHFGSCGRWRPTSNRRGWFALFFAPAAVLNQDYLYCPPTP